VEEKLEEVRLTPEERLDAVRALAKLNTPVESWDVMEREIEEGNQVGETGRNTLEAFK